MMMLMVVPLLISLSMLSSSHLLQSVLSLFPHQFIADRGLIFIQMIEDCDDRSFAKVDYFVGAEKCFLVIKWKLC